MRAHSLRRTLWFANVLLGAGVVGLGAWLVLDVMPAAADPAKIKAEFAAKELDEYKRRPNAAPQQNAPVSKEHVDTIARPEYQKLNYWIFSGPMPPEPTPEGPREAAPPPPTGLETLGTPASVIYMEPGENQRVAEGSVLTWRFPDKKVAHFRLGEFIRQKGQTERFRLVDIKRPERAVSLFQIVYDVYDDPKALPVKTGLVLAHDARPKVDSKSPFRDVPVGAPLPAEAPVGAGEKGTPGKTAVVPAQPPVAPPAPAPSTREVTFEQIKPEVRMIGADRVDVEFDQATYDFVRGKSVQSLAERVKTMPAIDQRTGQSLGLKITGIDAESPAQKFNVRPGDILVSVNGTKVANREELIALVQRMPADTSRVTVVIDRHGKMITFNIDPRDPATRRAARYLDQPK
jgi:hypothetical protein